MDSPSLLFGSKQVSPVLWNEVLDRLTRIESLLNREQEKPMNLVDAAKYLNVSKGHLYKLTCKCVIPFYKPNGKQIYFKKQELDEWIFRRRSVPLKEVRASV
jgi:excisionase family DNA binding protein